jgi:hypothetical protein
VLLLLQLGVQSLFYLLLWLFSPAQSAVNVIVTYATVFALQLVERAVRPAARFRILTTIAMCNTICLFYGARGGDALYMVPLAALAWLSRTVIVNKAGRHFFNPGTFGVFWGGLLCSKGLGLGDVIAPISHQFTHIPHFTVVVVALGTAMAMLGGHLDVVLALLTGTFITRRFGINSSELIIFFFAATDPATIPKNLGHRWEFGLIASIVTGILWQHTSNELVKVAGLMLAGLIMPLLIRLAPDPQMPQRFGRWGREDFWSRRPLRLTAAAVLIAYGLIADHIYPYRASEVGVQVVDAATQLALSRADARSLLAGDVTIAYGNEELRAFWSDLFGGWTWNGRSFHPEPLDEHTELHLSYRLACRPEVEQHGETFIHPTVSATRPIGALAMRKDYTILLSVDRAAIEAACR